MKRLSAAFGLGALAVGGFAPFHAFPLAPIALACLLALVERTSTRRDAFKTGLAFGLGHFLTGVSWVYVSLHDFGAMPAPAAAATTLLFCAYLALYPAAAVTATTLCFRAGIRRLLVFPAAWILTEWIRGWLFTGFPWLAIGYSQAPHSPLAGLAPVLGLHGVGFATALVAGLGLHAVSGRLRHPDWRALVGLILLCGLGAGLRSVQWTSPEGEPIQVSLLQGNIAQSMKWRPEKIAATLQLYDSMVRASGDSRLVVMPETAVPMFLQNVPRPFLEGIAEHARSKGADVLIGLPELAPGKSYYNSVISIGASPSQTYRKSHLVPFGEFIPLRPLLAPIVNTLAIPLTDFARGSVDQRPVRVAGQLVAVNICYEDAFGEEIIRQLPEATLLVNVSNVAWFGDSIAPMQHLQIAQMRALETGRYMLRSTNTGMTAVVDPDGTIVAAAPTFETRILQATVHGYAGATPFVRFGNLPIVSICALMLLGLAAMTVAHRAKSNP